MKAWALGWLLAAPLAAQVVPDSLTRAVLEEISAREAIAHARALAGYHRLPASQGFRDAAGYVMERATALGLRGVRLEQFPWDEPAWEPLEGEIDVIEPERARLASVSGNPLIAMTGSRGGEVTALAVDAGEGDDFSTLEVRNRIDLTRKVPSGEQWRRLAGRGAAALLCAESPAFFGRQTPRESVSWLTAPPGALAMAVSPAQASRLADWLRAGKPVRLRLRLKVRETRPGRLMQVTGEIPGTVSGRDVVLVAHLDHPRPSANDNASGSGALLECLRALQALAAKGTVPSPRRSIRFWWSTEILSEQRYFERYPEQAKRILLAVNLDQAGGDRHAENHFIVIGGPEWLPTWADDLIHALVEDVAGRYAPAEYAPHALTLAERAATAAALLAVRRVKRSRGVRRPPGARARHQPGGTVAARDPHRLRHRRPPGPHVDQALGCLGLDRGPVRGERRRRGNAGAAGGSFPPGGRAVGASAGADPAVAARTRAAGVAEGA